MVAVRHPTPDDPWWFILLDHDVDLDDLKDAIRAAWIADPQLAAELAKQYGAYDKVCLCCATRFLNTVNPTRVVREMFGGLAYQLCALCVSRGGQYP